VLKACPGAAVIAAPHGSTSYGNNFVRTLLRLVRETPPGGKVVDEPDADAPPDVPALQIWLRHPGGRRTASARTNGPVMMAEFTTSLVTVKEFGHGLRPAIFRDLAARGPDCCPPDLAGPITTAEYPTSQLASEEFVSSNRPRRSASLVSACSRRSSPFEAWPRPIGDGEGIGPHA